MTSSELQLRRLASLERSLGIPQTKDPSIATPLDIDRALRNLLAKNTQTIPKQLADELNECDRLIEELNPGSMLTYQSQVFVGNSGAKTSKAMERPLVYRCEEIISSAKSMKDAMDLLAQIQDLLLIGVKSNENTGPTSSATGDKTAKKDSDFQNAPILNSDRYYYATGRTAQKRLDDTTFKIASLRERSQQIANRVDALVGTYHRVVTTASEKMVLADGEL
eukprot:CAMPEP_0194365042 /NCGR_PEP_ID=MMETSP0174-20130528/13008_1 /TAXON_ID=216777 /ORGANISM="Proboscia alata, Strain PI-D3" /LENGTH=221 /DNA_ID=CAMNT_0039139451 /DNA_START=34 /DNA_END=699 /DNA_ORIENTATION=-